MLFTVTFVAADVVVPTIVVFEFRDRGVRASVTSKLVRTALLFGPRSPRFQRLVAGDSEQ